MTTSRSLCSLISTVQEVSVNTKSSRSSKLVKSTWTNAKPKTSSTKSMLTEEAKSNRTSSLSFSKGKIWRQTTKRTSWVSCLSSFCLQIKRRLGSLSWKKCSKIWEKASRTQKYLPWSCSPIKIKMVRSTLKNFAISWRKFDFWVFFIWMERMF